MTATVMAATQLSQTPVTTPVPGAVDATNGNVTPNSGATVFRLKNSDSGSTHTRALTSTAVGGGLGLADLVGTVPISGDVTLSQLPVDVFGAQVSWLASDGTHLTVS